MIKLANPSRMIRESDRLKLKTRNPLFQNHMRYRHGSSMEVHDETGLLDVVLDLLSVEPENLSSKENYFLRVMKKINIVCRSPHIEFCKFLGQGIEDLEH